MRSSLGSFWTHLDLEYRMTSRWFPILNSCKYLLFLKAIKKEYVSFLNGICLMLAQIFNIDTFKCIFFDWVLSKWRNPLLTSWTLIGHMASRHTSLGIYTIPIKQVRHNIIINFKEREIEFKLVTELWHALIQIIKDSRNQTLIRMIDNLH